MLTNYDGIYRIAQRVKREYLDKHPRGNLEDDLERLCKMKRLTIQGIDTPLSVKAFKAYYSRHSRKHEVVYNNKLHGRLFVFVILHELGHKILHWKVIDFTGHIDRNVFGVNSWMEVEANVFVAEILLDDEEVLDLIYNSGWSFEQVANYLQVPEEFLAFKCRSINHRLKKHIVIPCDVVGNCLKKMDNDDVTDTDDYTIC